MNRKHILAGLLSTSLIIAVACNSNPGNGSNGSSDNGAASSSTTSTESNTGASGGGGSSEKGIGKFQNVELTHPLDEKMITAGKNVYDVKCGSCHKLTDEKLVGPGWKGVTDRRKPEWIMNFITNTSEMLQKDESAQKMLEVCLVQMPNQGLSDQDARSVLEFMRKNDGKQ